MTVQSVGVSERMSAPNGVRANGHGTPIARARKRPTAEGKFLFRGDEKLYVRGVTYGTFRPGVDGHQFPAPEIVFDDFAAMAANGINSVRVYTVPPRWLLDTAYAHGITVM